MFVHRLTRSKHARDISGEGARLNGGRWNHKGVSCIYTSESRALCILEYAAQVTLDEMPRALSLITFKLPEKSLHRIEVAKLPGNWRSVELGNDTMQFGSSLLQAAKHLAIKIPSVIIPEEEYNIIINPAHPDIVKLDIINISDYPFDFRVKN